MRIGRHTLRNNVLLAPMTGVSDLPFRTVADRLGAGLVVSEMVASAELVRQRKDVVRRARGEALRPYVIQLVGCDAHWMAEGARIVEALGADIVDINMGCPRREVTGKLSGSALMRDLDHAVQLIKAVVHAVRIPVTLKMRLGWDHRDLNAPLLAQRAESEGVQLVTVHGRTRCQFFKGQADWKMVRRVSERISIPVVINGDICNTSDAKQALADSGADGVMIGRGAYGAPWLPGTIAASLAANDNQPSPSRAEQASIADAHIRSMLAFYGEDLGLRNARKHIGWYLQTADCDEARVKAWRRMLCTDTCAPRVLDNLANFYRDPSAIEASAACA